MILSQLTSYCHHQSCTYELNLRLIDNPKDSVNTSDDAIRSKHGPLVAAFWWITVALSIISVQFNWLRLSRCKWFKKKAYDTQYMKSKPGWQDLGLLWWLLLGGLALILVRSQSSCAICAGGVIAIYVVSDQILYHVRVLWLDSLRPAIKGSGKEVWSNRRILVVSILGYAWSIILFPAIYRAFGEPVAVASEDLSRLSFKTATTFDLSNSLVGVASFQIIVSLFFLAVVIAKMASISYKRDEVASAEE
jgi:hypothetical protein